MDTFFLILQLIGTVAFAVSGAAVGIRKEMDLFGVCILGTATAVGGGILRDLMLGLTPPMAFRDPVWLIVGLVASLLAFFPALRRPALRARRFWDTVLLVSDAVGMGVFGATAIELSQRAGQSSVWLLIFVALLTGTGGGVLRDILGGEVPGVFRKHVYASALLVGAGLFLLVQPLLPETAAVLLSVAVTVTLRCLAAHYRWNLPRAHALAEPEQGGSKAMDELREVQTASKRIYHGHILDFFTDTVRLPNGHTAPRELTRHVGAVCVVPLTDDGKVIVERQFRYPLDETILEIPAGKRDSKSEPPEEAARRELREETGIEPKELVCLGTYYPAAAYSDEVIWMYLARGLTFGVQKLDDDEFLTLEAMPLSDLVQEIAKGNVPDGKTQAAVLRVWCMEQGVL
ncbi:MAG: TRIC cation channel family protein [Oscillospiraceae bacterium]|nr:TRIC cation channel family protein [Oscillospiraceae bacterium]